MEAFLNAVWLVLAVSLVLAWRSRWLPQIRACASHERAQQSFIGLICVLAFLFPPISLSDDLHPVVIALSDTKSSFALAHGDSSAARNSRSHAAPHLLFAPAPPLRFRVTLVAGETLAGCPQTSRKDPRGGRFTDRAPPLFS
jgi:hypothetical protein